MAEERRAPAGDERRSRRLTIAAVVLGAASVVVGLLSVLGWLLGLAAIVVAGLAVRAGAARRGPVLWGSWLGVAGVVVTTLVLALTLRGS